MSSCVYIHPHTHIRTIVVVMTPLDSTSCSFTHRETLGFRMLLRETLAYHKGLGLNHDLCFTRATTWQEPYEIFNVFFHSVASWGQEGYMSLSTQTVYKGVISQISSRSEVLPLLSSFGLHFSPKTCTACRCSWNTESKITTWMKTIFLTVLHFHISHSVSVVKIFLFRLEGRSLSQNSARAEVLAAVLSGSPSADWGVIHESCV